jgi:hypothetical protein
VRRNPENTRIFSALRPFPFAFEQLPQNHSSIPDNPFSQFGTFPAAKPPFPDTLKGQALQKVQPCGRTLGQNRNPPSEHLTVAAHPIGGHFASFYSLFPILSLSSIPS